MRILLTGFEPFDDSSSNPSQEVVRRLAACPPEGVELHNAILPVDHTLGPQTLIEAIERSRPEAVICLGEASGRAVISIERLAVNLIDDRIPDNAGETWRDQEVVPGAPAAYFATLPVTTIQKAILKVGVPTELSLSAGTYLCNQVFYTLMHRVVEMGEDEVIPAGFIHLPKLPAQAAARMIANPESTPLPSMSLEELVRGVQAGLKVLAK